jgi:hypothetical protein
MAPATTLCSGIRPVVFIIIFVNLLILIQWSNRQDVAWLVLPAASQFNFGPVNITMVPREMHTGASNLLHLGCLEIGAMNLISDGKEVVLPPIVHLGVDFVKHLPHI